MTDQVTLRIDGQSLTVPAGTIIVDAAKQAGIDIPVFCYHPKMHPVGMCRMCLVEIGRPMVDRATGQPVLEADGSPKIQFGPKLETSCTTPVSPGMHVVTNSEKVLAARKDVIEFLLTSHPLDCPVCDKGGECPLQNLTMAHGIGESRFIFDEKHHAAKHVPLGELVFLDRERCIQCARCVRFQEEIVDDPVIGFYNRGRDLEIVTYSNPGFDSIFSGNTTDICPVGALTTADFRFGARPWEMKATAAICMQCSVGCNLTYNVRREVKSGGKVVIKRAMPRQNEMVNEIWICDKGRFGYQYAESPERITMPLVRQDDELVPTSWEVALEFAAEGLREAGDGLLVLTGGRLANEDLFNLHELAEARGAKDRLYTYLAGGDLTPQVGVAPGTNLSTISSETAILVIACDLHQEAPVWWLQVKAATERGAKLIVANGRATRLDDYASQSLRYEYGQEVNALTQAADLVEVKDAENLIIFMGSDGLGLSESDDLAQGCADLLVERGRVGQPGNGLIVVWSKANEQGAWDMGLRPTANLTAEMDAAKGFYFVGVDPFGDDSALISTLHAPLPTFLVVQDIFLTETAKYADVVLPALPITERDGTLTSGLRRVQRTYPAVPPRSDARPDYAITAQLAKRMDIDLEGRAAIAVWLQIGQQVPAYAGLTYAQLAEVMPQEPLIGRSDVYYGGTSYENKQGLGVPLPLTADLHPGLEIDSDTGRAARGDSLWAVPVTQLYDRGQTLLSSELLHGRIGEAWVAVNPQDSVGLIPDESVEDPRVQVTLAGQDYTVRIHLDARIPAGIALIPRSMGIPINKPQSVQLGEVIWADAAPADAAPADSALVE